MLTRYDLGYYLFAPIALPYLAYRWIRKGKYRKSGGAMFGRGLPVEAEREIFRGGSIWLHAVSVGETVAAKTIAPLLRELAPELPLVVTTITETGQAQARKIMTEANHIGYFPFDLSWNVGRFLDCFNPRIMILMEKERWPNVLTMAAGRGTKIFTVNGSLSDRSYHRYMKGRFVLQPIFDAIRGYCMQTESDAERMVDLCGRRADVFVTGNVKFDAPIAELSPEQAQAYRERFRLGGERRPLVVVGSTHPGEDEVVLRAYETARRVVPNLQMILSPRHPERFNEVAEQCAREGARQEAAWSVSRASAPSVDSPDILVLDTMGDLARVYGLGDVAVVAGSFSQKVGGHPLIEAAVHAVPVVVGPHMHGQREMIRIFDGAENGCVRVDDESLGEVLAGLFRDEERRKAIGSRARGIVDRNRGSARASIEIIRRYLKEGKP